MAEFLESVKTLAKNYRVWASDNDASGKTAAAQRQLVNAESLDAMIADYERLLAITKPIPASYGDLSDLPPELLNELTGIKVDDLEQQLFTIVKAGGEQVDLDAILIELFRRFKVLQTRRYLQNKLWRMAQKGTIYSVPGKKGVYTAEKPTFENPFESYAPPKGAFDSDLDDDVPF